MNRRSLLLGGVVASVAGILGVKARPVEVAATPASTEIRLPWVDGRDTMVKVEKPVMVQWEPIEEIYPALSGYQVNQLMEHGTPPLGWRAVSPSDMVPLMWTDEVMSTFNKPSLFRSVARMDSTYRHSINPDLSDLAADDSEDTDDYDFWDS